jgi:type I restriction enzyme S subunit
VGDVVKPVSTAGGVKREHYHLGSNIPIIDQGQTVVAGYTDDVSVVVPRGEYIVFGDHTRVVKWVDFAFAPGADGTKVLRATSEVVPKFAFYALSNLVVPSRGYNRHWTILRELPITVPPLEVQRDIVGILDTFTALSGNLEAELAARRRQFAHYRDALLTFSEAEKERAVRWVRLGDIATLVRGHDLAKADFTDSGVGCIHYGQIYTKYGTWTSTTVSAVALDKAASLAKVDPGDVIVTNTSENLADVCKAVAWVGDEQIVTGGHATVLKHNEDPKFLSYFFQTPAFYAQKKRLATGTKVVDVSARSLATIRIPLPRPEEQHRIVEILDKFDALVNDLSIGLPAELAARRKQYEYYRNRLLTFGEAA